MIPGKKSGYLEHVVDAATEAVRFVLGDQVRVLRMKMDDEHVSHFNNGNRHGHVNDVVGVQRNTTAKVNP